MSQEGAGHASHPDAGFLHRLGGEGKRAAIATALGIGLGALAAVFSRRERTQPEPERAEVRRWRGRSAT